jgi:predicted Rossmann-fold nucleotide-binding protein
VSKAATLPSLNFTGEDSKRALLGASLVMLLLAGCQALPRGAEGAGQSVTLSFTCGSAASVPKAAYVGPYAGVENVIPSADMARDVYCADAFMARKYPRGYVTVMGSSRIYQDNKACPAPGQCDPMLQDNDRIYAAVREFAFEWTRRHGCSIPIITGAGTGFLAAGSDGARAAGGPSIGYTTYYDRIEPVPVGAPRTMAGDPAKALNEYVTEGLIFTSVAQRESAMIRHSAAIVMSPGGTGTEWEIFQTIEAIKSYQQNPIPVYFLGEKSRYWASLEARLKDLVARKMVRQDELDRVIRFAATPAELVERLSKDLSLR